MVYSKPLNILVVLILLSFAKGFTLPGEWPFTKATGDTITTSIPNSQNSGTPAIQSDNGDDLNSFVGCSSISLNSQTWSLTTDATGIIHDTSEYVYGFWVNFESTISPKVFQFGVDNGPHYVVSSTENGILKVSYFSDLTHTDSANDFSFTVPLNKWLFIVFYFFDSSGTPTLKVILPGQPLISKNSGSSNVAFALPGGNFFFGKGIKGKFHRVVLAVGAAISGSAYDKIYLNDGSSNSNVAVPCTPGACIDSICPKSTVYASGNICLSSMHYCTICTASECTNCNPDTSRDEAQYCQTCKEDGTTNELKNYHCKCYLGCAKANTCAECSVKSTQCDACATGYFLNDDSATSTTSCLCKFYLACADSCTNCAPGPKCYTCAEAITQTGATCRVDSVGFQVSIDGQNIVFDFAHPLSTGLSKNSLKATSNSGADIDTSGWDINSCTAGSKQCKVNAPNLQESDLPIALEFGFTQV